MKKQELEQAVRELEQNRAKMQKQLLDFAITDLLFFFSDKPQLEARQKQQWQPILDWAAELLHIQLEITKDLTVPNNHNYLQELTKLFTELNDKEFCCWYAASLNLRSVLLGLAMVKQQIKALAAADLANLEELWQNEQWGEDEQAVTARQAKAEELAQIESFLLCAM